MRDALPDMHEHLHKRYKQQRARQRGEDGTETLILLQSQALSKETHTCARKHAKNHMSLEGG